MESLTYLIPVYNSSKWLKEVYLSLVNQTCNKFKIIFIDDGSSDGSQDIIKNFMVNDNRIRLIATKHSGIVNALNAGIKETKTDWIIRLDSDDICYKRRTEEILKVIQLKKRNIALISSNVNYIDKNSNIIGKSKKTNSKLIKYKLLAGMNTIYHPSVTIKKSALIELNGYREKYKHAEDYDLWLRLVDKYKIYHINKRLIGYRVHQNQITQKYRNLSLRNRLNALEDYIKNKSKNKGYKLILNLHIMLKRSLYNQELLIIRKKRYQHKKINRITKLLDLYFKTSILNICRVYIMILNILLIEILKFKDIAEKTDYTKFISMKK
tara:strand:- start:18887 stop:19858 length:972 start_codon:yes stop_codon:yes gene_type:complete